MSNYRILNITGTVPHQVMEDYYIINNLQELSYEEVIQKFRENGMIIPASWSLCMSELGNEVLDIIVDLPLIQEHWLRENELTIDDDNNTNERNTKIIYYQIKSFQPDVIYLRACYLKLPIVKELKREFPFIKVITGFHGDYLRDYKNIRSLDFVFTTNSEYTSLCRSSGLRAYTNHDTFDVFLDNISRSTRVTNDDTYEFIFAGDTGYQDAKHLQRYKNINAIMAKTDLTCFDTKAVRSKPKFINTLRDNLKILLVKQVSCINEDLLNKVKNYVSTKDISSKLLNLIESSINKKYGVYEPSVFPYKVEPLIELYPSRYKNGFIEDYYNLLRGAKVVFNAHRDEPADYANIRTFEVTGVGSCLMTDKPEKVKEFFIPDDEIISYTSPEECIEKLKYLLEHDSYRNNISKKGQEKTLKNYTTMNQCEKMHDVIVKQI
jgi:spore maturation protein CgeB